MPRGNHLASESYGENRPGPVPAKWQSGPADSCEPLQPYHHPKVMTLTTILLIVLLLILIGGIPTKGYGVGHGLNGGLGLVLVILFVLYLMGKI